MEINFSQLKQKDVISLADGKCLGKVCDVALCFPENRVKGIMVTGGKTFRFLRQEQFLPVSAIVRIGEDAVLVNYDPKEAGGQKCPPPQAQFPPPPPPQPPFPPPQPPQPRRNFDEYE